MTNRIKMTRRFLSRGTAFQALALLGAGAGMAAVAAPAAAQDYTSGAVTGKVIDNGGKPVPGAQVTLTSQAQGQARTLTASGSGAFSAVGLAPGAYSVDVSADGYQAYNGTISVVAAQENSVSLTLISVNAPADIVVTGTRVRQDFTKTTTGLNIDVPQLASQIAVPRTLSGLIALAPTTNAGATGFGDVQSIGGSSVAENAYYINGLNITNPDTYVNSARVPFDFYKTVDVQTGGYAAEFGRATGGVINATTKSGSNTPFMAIHGNFEPSAFQANSPNTGIATKPFTIGRLGKDQLSQMSIEAGGALIKDHLFIYGLVQNNIEEHQYASVSTGFFTKQYSATPFYGGKADLYLTSTQHLEFTYFNTTQTTYQTDYSFTPNAQFNGGTVGPLQGTIRTRTGGENWVARYTGNVTDFFQISGAYGVNRDANDSIPSDTSAYYVIDRRTATTGGAATVISKGQPYLTNSIADTRRRFYRADGDLRFELLGSHHVRFGFDNEDLSENKNLVANGVLPLIYDYRNAGIRVTYENLGGSGHLNSQDRAYYIQDSWEPFTGLTINGGVRDDEFRQNNLIGQQYMNFTGNIAARIGFSFTPNGTSRLKVFGNYGRYFIPPAMNLGFRGHDDYFREYFTYGNYTAANFPIDPNTGLPLVNVGPARTDLGGSGYYYNCPTDISAGPGHPVNGNGSCLVFGGNVQDPAAVKVAPGTKATYEDEFILGTRFQVTPLLSVGLTGTYRKLSRISEDTDFSPLLYNFYNCGGTPAAANAAQCDFYGNNSAYYIWNPGSSSLTLRDWVDSSRSVTLTGLTFPKPRRDYKALVLDWKRADDGKWFSEGSITLSRSYGNYEGTVISDAGNGAQTDAGSTQAFDYLGLTDYQTGLLPNDRTLVIKAFGAYHLTPNLLLGANLSFASPLHESCEGFHPTDPNAAGYGASSFYCAYGPLNTYGDYATTQPSPRGKGPLSDWTKQVDLSARFKLPKSWGLGEHFLIRADVFNVFNTQGVIQRYVQHETQKVTEPDKTTGYTPDPQYGAPLYYQTPRYARVGFDISF